jgi:hypothetical protein
VDEPEDDVSPDRRSWLAWLLPFLVSGGMAFGAMIGLGVPVLLSWSRRAKAV